MAPQEIINALHRRPFIPFQLTATEGSTYIVRHPELCMVGRFSAIIGIISPNASDTLFEQSVTLDLLHIVKMEPVPPAPSNQSSESKAPAA